MWSSSQQELELIDLDKVLVNDASESMTLFDQVVGSLHSIFPDNAMEVRQCNVCPVQPTTRPPAGSAAANFKFSRSPANLLP